MNDLVDFDGNSLRLLDFTRADWPRLIVLALGHALWQAAMVAAVVAWLLKRNWLGLALRFRTGLLALLLVGILPFANLFWLFPDARSKFVPVSFHVVDGGLNGTDVTSNNSQEDQALENENRDRREYRSSDALLVGFENPPSEVTGQAGSRVVAPLVPDRNFPSARGKDAGGGWRQVYRLIALLYLLGVVVMTCRIARGLTGHRVARNLLDQCESEMLQVVRVIAQRAASKLDWRGSLRIGLVTGSSTAAVIGCFRPVILVNLALATGLTPRQLEQILAHELAHLLRLDPLTLFLQRMVEATQFYNPATWYLSRRVSELRELCCDQHVARHYDSTEYAETLVECAAWEHSLRHPIALAISGTSASALRQRVCVLLDQPVRYHRQPWLGRKNCLRIRAKHRAWIAFGILVASGLLAAVLIGQDPAKPGEPDPEWPWQKPTFSQIDKVAMAFRSQSLILKDQVPPNIHVEAMVDMNDCRFAQWQFGDQRSRSVAIMVEMLDGEPTRIYLDRNRDQVIDSNERLPESKPYSQIWKTDLEIEIHDLNHVYHVDRPIAIDLNRDQRSVRITTLGYAEGKLDIGNRQFTCRRFDNDGDGIPLSWRDELLIDLNGDDQFDEVTERFNYQPCVEIEGKKFGLQSDAFGQQIKLTEAPALGSAEFRLNLADSAAQVVDLQGTFRDRHGSFVTFRMDQTAVDVLPGEYCIESLALAVKDARGDIWYLTMSRGFESEWFKIESEQRLAIDLLSKLEMEVKPESIIGAYGKDEAGFTPYLTSSDGLIITEFKRNKTEDVPLTLSLSRPDRPEEIEQPVVCTSGFS